MQVLPCFFSSNVLLDKNFTAKLSDFGIARVLVPSGDATRGGTQKTSRVQGTNAYLSPEASRGTITVKMDAFALAIVSRQLSSTAVFTCTFDILYQVFLELLTGLSPFDSARDSQDLVMLTICQFIPFFLIVAGISMH